MRVISGKFGKRRLVSFKDDRIRPTTDRVKESLFNILSDSVEGARVLDLFCGTGSLGLEAISRGASHVDFVDSSSGSLAIVQKNIELLKVTKDQFSIIKSDALSFLRSLKHRYDLILIDPPFTKKMADVVMKEIGKISWEEPSFLAIESVKGEVLLDDYGLWRRVRVNDYGDKALNIYSLQTQIKPAEVLGNENI